MQEEQHNTDMQGQRPSVTLSSLELSLQMLQVLTAWPRALSKKVKEYAARHSTKAGEGGREVLECIRMPVLSVSRDGQETSPGEVH